MKHQPRIQERAAQPYLAIPLTVTMEGGFGEEVESGFSELFGWLEEHGVAPAGAPFTFLPARRPAARDPLRLRDH
jgi:hypothetical protein